MGWRAAADATLVAHFGFILFMVAGGFLARRRSRVAPIHLLVLAYGVTISTFGFRCPLTPLEQSFRRAAGDAGYDESFVEHYLLGVVYPGGIDTTVRVAMVVGLVAVLAVSYGPRVVPRRRITSHRRGGGARTEFSGLDGFAARRRKDRPTVTSRVGL